MSFSVPKIEARYSAISADVSTSVQNFIYDSVFLENVLDIQHIYLSRRQQFLITEFEKQLDVEDPEPERNSKTQPPTGAVTRKPTTDVLYKFAAQTFSIIIWICRLL